MGDASSDTGASRARAPGALITRSSFSWSVGILAPSLVTGVSGALLLYYLVYQVKLDPGVAGVVLFAASMFDIPLSPIVGVLSDHTHSRWGRRRPYLLAAAILMPASWLLLFNIPVTGLAALVWAVSADLLLRVGMSAFVIPHSALANEITDVPQARVRMMSLRVLFLKAGGLLAGLAPLMIHRMPGQKGYLVMSLCVAAGCAIPCLVTFFGTQSTPPRPRSPPVKFSEMFHGFAENRPFVVMTVGRLASLALASGQIPVQAFFLQAVMKLPISALATFAVANSIVGIVAIPVWERLIRRFGMQLVRDCVVVLGIIYCLSYLVAQPHEPIIGIVLRAVLFGLLNSGWQLVAATMQADVIDYDYALTGRRREGLFSAFYSFADKTSAALGVLGVTVMLSAVGFDKTLDPTQSQAPHVMMGLYAAMAILPTLGYVITFICYRFYHLDPARGITPENPKGRAISNTSHKVEN